MYSRTQARKPRSILSYTARSGSGFPTRGRSATEKGVEAAPMMYGGIEAGGTKIVCAVGTGPTDLRAQISFPTTTPGETLARMIAFFQQQQLIMPLAAIGIGSFGPISLDHHASDYG